MNCRMMCSCWIFILLVYCSQVKAAAVVWPGATLSPYDPVNYNLSSDVSSYGGVDVTLLVLDGGTLSAQSASVGIRQIWVGVSAGTPIDATLFASAPVFANNSPYILGSIQMTQNNPFYLGFWLGGAPSGQGPVGGQGSVYGWASLVYDGTALTLLDSAAETTGVGIYADTYTAIPEPCAAGLVLTGLVVMAIRRRLRRDK